jgi:hypothetical protein
LKDLFFVFFIAFTYYFFDVTFSKVKEHPVQGIDLVKWFYPFALPFGKRPLV